MKTDSRTVHFFDLEICTISQDDAIPIPPQISLGQLLPRLIKHMHEGTEIKCGKTPIELTKISWSEKTGELILLLNKPDPERSDVSYRKRNSRSRRPGDKALDEDIEVSSHVFIKIPKNSTKAMMLLTTGASISPAKIVSLFNSTYKNAKDSGTVKQFCDIPLPTNVLGVDGKAKTYSVKHRFEFNAMPNGLLKDIVRTGKIVGLNLIDTGREAFDTSTRVLVDKMVIHVNLESEEVDVSFIKKLLNIAKTRRKFDCDQIRIEYTDGVDDNAVKQRTFDAARLEDAFTRSETFTLDNLHYDHQTHISDEIIEKMRALT